MTDNTDKIRSVLLAALMVFSVFAGTVAFAGSAAATSAQTNADDPVQVTLNNGDSINSTETKAVYAFSITDSGTGNNHSIYVNNTTVDLAGGNATASDVSSLSLYADTDGNTAWSSSEHELTTVTDPADLSSVMFDISPVYNQTEQNSTQRYYVVATIASGATNDSTIQGQSATIGLENNTQAEIFSDYDTTATLSESGDSYTIDPNASSGGNDGTDTSGQNAAVANGSIIYQGQTVKAYGFASNQDVILSSGTADEPGTFQNSYEADANGNITFGTSNLETGQNYFLQGDDGNGDTVGFQVVEHQLSLDVEDTELGNAGGATTTTAEFDSNRQQFDAYVSSDDLDVEEVEAIIDDDFDTELVDLNADETDDAIQVTVDRGDEYTLNASDIDAGEYALDFEAVDTTASVSTDLNVSDVGAGEAEFETSSFTVEQGDVASVNISLDGAAEGTSGTLTIGDEEGEGYQANVSFTDGDADGEVTVLFNTYAAGSTGNGTVVEAAAEDDSVTFDSSDDQSTINNILAQGDYTLSVSTSDDAATTIDQPQDIGALAIGPRSTEDLQLWMAPEQAELDADDEDGITEGDIATLIEDDVVTETDGPVTSGDYAIHQVSATGLEGLVESEGGLGAALQSEGVLSLSIVQTNPVQNRDAKEVNISASTGALDFVEGDDTYYIISDTDSLTLEDDTRSVAAGDEYEATFTVADDRLLRSTDDDDHESVNATFEIEEAATELDSDPVEVAADSGQTVSGSTNYAPGTELTIRVRSTSDVSPGFFNTQNVVVQPDGTFSAEFDFSEQAAEDTFGVSVRKGGDTVATADGEVVESISTPTPTETEPPETDTPTETEPPETDTPTETEPPETDTEEPDTTTTTTPGFGIAVALVALLAAALLAGRRE